MAKSPKSEDAKFEDVVERMLKTPPQPKAKPKTKKAKPKAEK